jgi:hypothetical protein
MSPADRLIVDRTVHDLHPIFSAFAQAQQTCAVVADVARHVLVSHGKVARRFVNGGPEVLEDYLPKLRAIDLLLKIERERRTIIGYTAPSKRVLEVITEDQLERAIRQYIAEAEALERDAAEIEARRKAVS